MYLAEKAPLRGAFSARFAALSKILTMVRETVNHLLLHCKIASALWYYIFDIFGLAWIMPRQVRDLLACWRRKTSNSQSEALWKIITLCLMWCIWRERNDQSFEDSKRTVHHLVLNEIHLYNKS
jgi:hypothetical protein